MSDSQQRKLPNKQKLRPIRKARVPVQVKRSDVPSAEQVLQAGRSTVKASRMAACCASDLCGLLSDAVAWVSQIAGGTGPKPSDDVSNAIFTGVRAVLEVKGIICVLVEDMAYRLNDSRLLTVIPDLEKPPDKELHRIWFGLMPDMLFHLPMLPLRGGNRDSEPRPAIQRCAILFVVCLNELQAKLNWIERLSEDADNMDLPIAEVRRQAHQAIQDLCNALADVPARMNREFRLLLCLQQDAGQNPVDSGNSPSLE